MELFKQLDAAMDYIEAHLCGGMDLGRAAKISGVSQAEFLHFFSCVTGMTLTAYVRRRRLTQAAFDLQNTSQKVLDIAVKYGWNSADAFSRAFAAQHGVTPSKARRADTPLKIVLPVSFHITMQGAGEVDFQLVKQPQTVLYGISRPFDPALYESREALRHSMWSQDCEFIPGRICDGYDGIWYGVWQGGRYLLARKEEDAKTIGLERYVLPGGTYAKFCSGRGGRAWEELPKLFETALSCWLPGSGYRQAGEMIAEVYHLWNDRALRRKNRYYELYIPVEKAQRNKSV